MPKMEVIGGERLVGDVTASGAKNAVLPILAACILLDGETNLTNAPYLGDVNIMLRMLSALGMRAEHLTNDEIHIRNDKKLRHIAPYDLVTAMRASFFVAGPLLAKTGFAKVPLPGGCSIGSRPVDIHLDGFKALGADVSIEHGFVQIKAKSLKGANIRLAFPSVGATENLMMAASLAKGETVLTNVAKEPEIVDLAEFLIAAGAQIEGAGTGTIRIQGVQSLNGLPSYSVIPDRIEVGTLMIAAAITAGEVTIHKTSYDHIASLAQLLLKMGVTVEQRDTSIFVSSTGEFLPVNFETEPYPGFPTDMQAQMMSLLCVAKGKSRIKEAIFENRFMHVSELIRMGAKIEIDNQYAFITGVPNLSGAEVRITDLRAGAALVLGGLVADGRSIIHGLKHLRRGYHHLAEKLITLGANIIQ
ncbi:UDP-N-acetylglucosamine 1-carboxyvinyltransferase [Candidatus Marinamargulisbacteria bacterium SCGC AG-414-C22]|nr:UDP-N-acetylglucosamine 1-carboxyvinyltransferase [Candidatus Marinamargulisbacteria bacterium SCGC AG-414-C22]